MCDCYEQKCEYCNVMIPVHITDFCTPRENVKVFCSLHIPEEDCFVHTVIEAKSNHEFDYEMGTTIAFRILDKQHFRSVAYDPCGGDDFTIAEELKKYGDRMRGEPWEWATPNISQRTVVVKRG